MPNVYPEITNPAARQHLALVCRHQILPSLRHYRTQLSKARTRPAKAHWQDMIKAMQETWRKIIHTARVMRQVEMFNTQEVYYSVNWFELNQNGWPRLRYHSFFGPTAKAKAEALYNSLANYPPDVIDARYLHRCWYDRPASIGNQYETEQYHETTKYLERAWASNYPEPGEYEDED